MNLGVNCLSIKSAKPNNSLLNTDKNAEEDGGVCMCTQTHRAVYLALLPESKCHKPRAWQGMVSDPSWDATWLGYHVHVESITRN